MKKFIPALLCLVLAFTAAFAEEPAAEYAVHGDTGKVVYVETAGELGAVVTAEGYWGYHMDEDPSVTVLTIIGTDGLIRRAVVTAMKAQTPGFADMITQEYLDNAYIGKPASANIEVDACTGATATSLAVEYAVRAAGNYVNLALGINADTSDAETEELKAVVDADYKAIDLSGFESDAKKLGTVLYAAEGVTPEGREVLAVKVTSMTKPDQSGSARTGWTAATPNPFTMIIVIDCAEGKVIAWNMVQAGYKNSDLFTVTDELIDNYKNVEITDEKVFDEFFDGSVMTMELETTESEDGPVVTGTSVVYTGKTQQGTFSSQFIRSCFRTAAKLFCFLYR